MSRTPLNRMLTERVLTRTMTPIGGVGQTLIELMLENTREGAEYKQLCAKISPQLMERLDQITGILDIHKRAFVEAAIIEALQQAERIMEEEDFFVAIGVEEPEGE